MMYVRYIYCFLVATTFASTSFLLVLQLRDEVQQMLCGDVIGHFVGVVSELERVVHVVVVVVEQNNLLLLDDQLLLLVQLRQTPRDVFLFSQLRHGWSLSPIR